MKRHEFVLMKFKKNEDRLSGELVLSGLTVSEARRITGSASTDPMYESLQVTSSLARRLQHFASENLDTKRFDYFLERRYADE